jgi:acyl-CoA thioester hydrolase
MRDGLILADADVTAVFVSPGGRARRQPKDWVTAFERLVWPNVEDIEPPQDAVGE